MKPVSDDSESDWKLRAWMRHRGKKQAHMVSELGWTRGRASKVVNGSLAYRRDVVNVVTRWLGIQTYEIFLTPEEAHALRSLRDAARVIMEGQESGPGDRDTSSGGVTGRGRAAG